ncbi:MAG: hypothetical protein FJ206_10545 [Gemmatimonadetes bacterium]|nr:hypothetical protein [Gemmatimonadota bacterium]
MASSNVTSRLRRLVDDVHDGNLFEASVHAGLPYATLREIHLGRARRPGHQTLERLARVYGLPLEWFLGEPVPDDRTLPMTGWVGFVPFGAKVARRITIPHAAWPLIRVLVRLEQRLREMPASVDRPIIGLVSDPRDIRNRLTAFVLQPLLATRGLPGGAAESVWSDPIAAAGDRWIGLLSDLGRFWEQALAGLIREPGADGTQRAS